MECMGGRSQVHEEVLRLLLAAVPQLGVERLAQLLATTLANSKRSRKCAPHTCIACCLNLRSFTTRQGELQ